ncbi:hypothetical protein [Mycolicibacterium hodleri]|uniref:PE-PPE domain-containing protein n=1 Tax=Mycolicibacterium hodleri TaxID=49897 RepID=A0A502E745_9MYCO|nr:hypothetical protein [Mycolicibacterium hodleri]TPG32271.1 hypothetical protein EAH80_20910 [Mycolicibacterium hodleri]
MSAAALRPYVTAGVALVGASIISVTPIAPTQIASPGSDIRVSTASVDLVASVTSCTGAATDSTVCGVSSLPSFMANGTPSAFQTLAATAGPSVFNIPANLLITLANIPYNLLTALGTGDDGTGNPLNLGAEPNSGFSFTPNFDNVLFQRPEGQVVGLTSDLNFAGNIWVYSPTNVLGTDPGDIARYQALLNVAVPIPALSVGLGNIVTAIAASQLPMSVGCTGTGLGACPDIFSILGDSLQLQNIYKLFTDGYTFPTVTDPITCTDEGACNILDPAGPQVPQSGQTVKLDLSAPFTNFYNSLLQTPDFSTIKVPTLAMTVSTLVNLVKGFNTFLNPFVLGTQCTLCAYLVPNPDHLPIPGPINPGTQAPPFTPPVGPFTQGTTMTTLAAADSTATDTTNSSNTPLLKKLLAKPEKTQATPEEDVAAAAAAVNAAGTEDPTPAANTLDQATSTTSTPEVSKPKPTPKHAKPENGLAGAIKDAFSNPFKGSKTSGDTASTSGDTAPKVAKTPKANKVAKAADSDKGGASGGSGNTDG